MPVDQLPAVLLISVDPERDTPMVLKSYLAGFEPSFSGLTGDPEALRAFATALFTGPHVADVLLRDVRRGIGAS